MHRRQASPLNKNLTGILHRKTLKPVRLGEVAAIRSRREAPPSRGKKEAQLKRAATMEAARRLGARKAPPAEKLQHQRI